MSEQNDTTEFPTLSWSGLQEMAEGSCPCCDEPFRNDMRPELTGNCHTGPVFVSYWGRFLYIECGVCRKPICKIPLDGRLV